MCAKKLKYTAGDDLQLYATPKQALEANRRILEEEKLQRQQKYEMKMSQEARINGTRISSAPSSYIDYKKQNNSNHSLPGSRISSNQQLQQQQQQQHQNQSHIQQMHRVLPQQRPSNMNDGTYIHASKMGIVSSNGHSINSRPVPNAPIPIIPAVTRGSGERSSSSSPRRRMSPGGRKESVGSTNQQLKEERDISVATQLFYNHDIKKRERLTAEELQNLLQNDDSTRFSISTIDSLINLFGAARFGTVNLNEFVSLYKRVKAWRKVYVDNDINGSFTLSLEEYQNSLKELGYMIPFEVGEKLFDQYAEFNIKQNSNTKELKFDKFVESLVWLLQLTKQFRKYDTNQEGVAIIQYKDFIETTLFLGRHLPH
ncbi:similar to Saccharomyces cerevisiae YGR058W PEF1 Penta-EF-hand protein required for polar bud growth and cell wall abscission [Maudiozyma barnettii]|uniref:Similar to Saccharomyces cerevisiae YGR058W PEF1 Penta-EF-hand protein required for polar bud growth and cell wall abscission n=1 Tax=Maudiozyma barnettii TaxID=61262 RepID=A0A8H2VC64_9SACH|nr:Pef1p [Kazachstania barnettii]CAB4252583.1 similar to Saccharomyces cerevisiae YGR058W PEF1 Penta-EF-hand protein required for polar bud growth and cell wall abscission [Kazachstania barnettii]CAD1779320.1 similar to Saccharomyces cerevisiae YGR058W PEF1 Penta-EF-hand protein required for polar bud growth and cell wall abscission [Kazachstania barnettii]